MIKMKIRKKNQNVQELIENLNRLGYEKDADVWKAVAKNLNRPTRNRYELSVSSLEKNTKSKETVVVPGAVLGSGEISKPLTIAALKFSKEAREKIKKAGGTCMDIEELMEKNPKGHKVRIMG
jgi:large subunit ribosomal protein L18e